MGEANQALIFVADHWFCLHRCRSGRTLAWDLVPALSKMLGLPPLAMAPISARAVYVWALMLMMLLWLWLQLRAAKLQRARDVELIMRAQERLQTMQQVLESLDAESTKIALKALSFEDDGPSAKRQEKATATTK